MLSKYIEWVINQPSFYFKTICLAVITSILMMVIHSTLAGANLIGLQLSFSLENFHTQYGLFNAEQIYGFKQHFWLDMIYPLFYGLLFSFLFALLIKLDQSRFKQRWMILLGPVAALCDLIESLAIIPFLNSMLAISESAVLVMSIAAAVKWLLILLMVVRLTIWGGKSIFLLFSNPHQSR